MWKRLYLSPLPASRSAVGVWQGPPKALEAPKPHVVDEDDQDVGGAPGGRSGSIGGNAVSGILGVVGDQALVGMVGDRQDVALNFVRTLFVAHSFPLRVGRGWEACHLEGA